MSVRWVVDEQHPDGYAVAMTAEEESELLAYRTAAAAEQAEDDAEASAVSTLRDRISGAIDTLEQAWANWATLTDAQKDAAQKLNVRVTVALGRLAVRRLDG